MEKPTIFFSHSSRNKNSLGKLKNLFNEITNNTINVFLSSDGQSIPLGRNWIYSIQDALEESKLMFVFISPDSLNSHWLFFEAGYVYSKKIRVIPIGILGMNLELLAPPLSLLQGFNIASSEGLNNIIAVINDEFKVSHDKKFRDEDYRDIFGVSFNNSNNIFSDYGQLIDTIQIIFEDKSGYLDLYLHIKRISEYLNTLNIEHFKSNNTIDSHGVSIVADQIDEPHSIKFNIDPMLSVVTLPIVSKILNEIRNDDFSLFNCIIEFYNSVSCVDDKFKISSRIFGTEIKITEQNNYEFKDLEFALVSVSKNNPGNMVVVYENRAQLRFIYRTEDFPSDQIAELITLLFNKEVLFIPSYPNTYNLTTSI